jgi:ATP-dependent HslUV protease subunit HslV
MTIIAYRNGILATDTASCVSSSVIDGIRKAVRRGDGVLAAATGDAGFMGEFLRWASGLRAERPNPQKDQDGCDRGILIYPDGRIEVYEPSGMFELRPEYYAAGSGRDLALGAFYAGADAETAVRAAIHHDCYCAGDVFVLRH